MSAAAGSVHLTYTGVYAGWPLCQLTEDVAPMAPYRHLEGESGAHFVYAPAAMVDGSDPRVCRACVALANDDSEDEPAALEVGATVVASNPGGREITGKLVGWASYDDHVAGELALVEWFGPCPMMIVAGDMVPNGEPTRYVGRFTTFAAATS